MAKFINYRKMVIEIGFNTPKLHTVGVSETVLVSFEISKFLTKNGYFAALSDAPPSLTGE